MVRMLDRYRGFAAGAHPGAEILRRDRRGRVRVRTATGRRLWVPSKLVANEKPVVFDIK